MLFTQNIDCLERRAGVPTEKIIEAHGSFATQRCIECKTEYPDNEMEAHVFKGVVPFCNQEGCDGAVKPDIVFFGEALPAAFAENADQAAMADIMLVLGTSLTVYPFAGLPDMARQGKPRVLFNMERVGNLGGRADDVLELGSCDEGIRKLADELGWRDELETYWRELVGDEEADRQLSSAAGGEDIDDEVHRLADGVENALRIGDSASEDERSNTPEITQTAIASNALGDEVENLEHASAAVPEDSSKVMESGLEKKKQTAAQAAEPETTKSETEVHTAEPSTSD